MLDGMTDVGVRDINTARRDLRPVMQRSLKRAIPCVDKGLHSGVPVTMTLRPAPAGHGVVFKRTDVDADQLDPFVKAKFDAISDTRLCSTVSNADGVSVATIEHLMAALYATGVDNVLVELDGPETPVMDGSSEPFIFLIDCAGTVDLDAPRKVVRVLKDVRVETEAGFAALSPVDELEDGLTIDLTIDFPCDVIGRQSKSVRVAEGRFAREIAKARTFGFMHEVDAMRKAGLALGGGLDNAVVIDGETILNKDGLRYRDEFVRHKILDCIGDLALCGAELVGAVRAERTGHALNNALLHALFSDPSNYEIVDAATVEAPMAAGRFLAAAE